ncbi:MAG: histone deacetylase family protein [Alphaproteobacteria bacterium]|nr:histone deacetylase family protein [Alphaproteobacteria bacterium]
MSTMLFYHAACLRHDTGLGHPERPERLRAVMHRLEAEEFAHLDRRDAPRASEQQLLRVHDPDYIAGILQAEPQDGHVFLDGDTLMSPGSTEAALRAAGAVCAAVDAVVSGEGRNAFCAVRPPGHHAEPERAMGFCLFNNIAIGAMHARTVHNLRRIAVVDFDVHHGNGTQASFASDPDLLYASTHQWPLYPGTGHPRERGLGNIFNLTLEPEAGSREFRAVVERELVPALDAFRPELLLVSAGFDGHRADPLAELNLTEEDYGWVTAQLCAVANRHAKSRLVSALEGGYDLNALASAAAAHVRALMVN